MKKYLYGAAIQGIQTFIFQTNKLKDIVGASELVEDICTEEFKRMLGNRWDEKAVLIGAAGNVKYVFDDKDRCADAVMRFPKMVMRKAPGITISQAVVEFEDGVEPFSKTIDRLEAKLRAERNRPSLPLTTGLLGVMRSRQTGLPVTAMTHDGPVDATTQAKRDILNLKVFNLSKTSFFGKESGTKLDPKQIAFEVSDMTHRNDWLAVIHADGNSLGQVVQAVGHDREKFREFSKKLDESTIRAANEAFKAIRDRIGKGKIPVRPVVLGGDDMTVIIRGSLAVDYAKAYLENFEKYTQENLGKILTGEKVFADNADHLSACAGIAFIKSSYPFYYGYQLAEQLCEEAKRVAKTGLAEMNGRKALSKSCLMFHKVQDSFITSYKDIVSRELTTKAGISLKFGPYYIESEIESSNPPEGSMTINQLLELCSMLNDAQLESVKTGIRRWLTLLHDNPGRQGQHLQRMKENYDNDEDKNKNKEKALKLINALTKEHRGAERAVCAFDALSLYTIINQVTKNDEHETDTL